VQVSRACLAPVLFMVEMKSGMLAKEVQNQRMRR
jgi:hypothetical protein